MRTTPLLPGLKKKYPESFVSWLVDEESVELLQNNPFIDRILPFNLENTLWLLAQTFDVLISLDKEAGPASVATQVRASEKFGFGLNEHGNLRIFNTAAEYAYRLGVDDPLKFFANRKTYQELIYEIAELEYRKDDYVFSLKEESAEKAKKFFQKNKVSKSRISVGLNTGAGTKFETKQWPRENFLELIGLLQRGLQANVFLLGGPKERELNHYLEKKARSQGFRVFNTGNDNSLLDFAGFLSLMDIVVCSDTLAMHLALALRRKTVALFGPTCAQEIELYGRGAKIFLGLPCSPCYKQICPDAKCMSKISARKVFQEIRTLASVRHG